MSDTAQDPIDLDTLTDDEVMNLGPDQIQALMEQEETADAESAATVEDTTDPGAADTGDGAEEKTEGEDDTKGEEEPAPAEGETPPAEDKVPGTEETSGEPAKAEAEDPEPKKGAEEELTEEQKAEAAKKAEEDKAKKQDNPAEVSPEIKAATEFYAEITKPFKADGKDFQVKTAAEAIRLMQMGANYSRRMQEMKPLKAMDAVLKEHGLDNPDKLAQLIDISKGDPKAIQKLLKEKGIDPLDIDVSKPSEYTAKAYTADEKAIGFKDAIANTLQAPGGKELIADMNTKWDAESKDALFESPAIFDQLLSHKSAVDNTNVSDYSKINAEVERQRVLGYLTDVPFLQAYTQVSDAMANLDLLTSAKKSTPAAPAKAPIDTGPRKAAVKPKTEQPNPTLSSNPPKAAATPAADNQIDYSAMSDEDFLKLGAPG